MLKKIFAAILCLALLLCCVPGSVWAATTIEKVSVTIPFPQAGQTPSGYGVCGNNGYKIHTMDWYDRDTNRFLEAGQAIQAGHSYEVQIWVEAESGYEFRAANDNTPAVTATVNGEAVEVTKAFEYKAWAMVVLTYYISNVPSKGWVTRVDIPVPEPVAGQEAYYGKISTPTFYLGDVSFSGSSDPDMKNGIKWYRTSDREGLSPNGDHTFDPNTAYTFRCLVFPQDDYRLTPNAAVTVNGKWARSDLDYDTFLTVTYDFPATGEVQEAPHTHTLSAWRTTGAYHYTACTTCGDFLDQEDHKGGTATCTKEGICSVCGYAYLPVNENHTPDSKWTACGGLYHAKLCKLCGAHCDPQDHVPGPAATETEPQKCTVCDYILDPAKNHKHTLTHMPYVAATCLTTGTVEHYACSGCTALFSDKEGKQPLGQDVSVTIPYLTHEPADSWSMDAQYHWRVCKLCDTVLDETKLLHDGQDGKCATCGYTAQAAEEPTEATKPSQSTEPSEQPTQPSGQKKGNSWLLPVLIGVVCFAAAITATVLILKKKK